MSSSSGVRKKGVVGIAIGKSAVVAVEAQSYDPLVLKDCKCAALSGELSVSGAGASMEPLKQALTSLGLRSKTIALSLPDVAARTFVLEFEELPSDPQEAGQVIKWKAAKGVFRKPDECCIDFQILPTGVGKKALAVVVDREVVEAYEDAFTALGLSVKWVGINSFDAFNLFSDRIAGVKEFAVLTLWPDYFACFAFRDGTLDFYRLKETVNEQELLSEVATSFAFYAGKNPDKSFEKVFLLGAEGNHALPGKIGELAAGQVESVDASNILEKKEGVGTSGAPPLLVLSAAGALVTPGVAS